MTRWRGFISVVDEARLIAALGGLYVVLAAGRALQVTAVGGPLGEAVSNVVLVGIPGLLILYGGYRLPDTDLHPDTYPRVLSWSLGGFGLLLSVVGLRIVSPGVTIDEPLWSAVLATALGTVAGLAIGMNQARAFSRAREAEQHNRELRRYETLIEETTDVNAILDPDATFQYLTPSTEHVLGYAPDDLVGEQVFEYVHPEDRQEVTERFAKTLERGRSGPLEFRFRHDDGSWVVLEGSGRNLLDDPAIEGIVAYTYDVTERKELEDNLRRERDLRERIVETSPIGIVVVDSDGRISFANEHAAEMLEFSKDELTNLRYDESMFGASAADGSPAEEEIFQPVRSSGEPVYNAERRVTRSDGRRIWLSVNAAPLGDMSGDTTGVVFAFEDVTERKRYQNRLVSINELSRSLTDAETRETVGDLAVETARDTLSVPAIAIAYYDEETGRLWYASRTEAVTELVGDGPLFESDRSLPWQVFVDQTRAVHSDLLEQADVSESETPLRSAVVLPLGEHGVFVCGATVADAFSDTDVALARMLVENTRSALDRVNRERTLRERKNRLEEQYAALERVQRVNETIRGITKDLIESSTSEEIVQAVCDRLASADVYRFAWIGTHDPVTDEVTPEAWGGVEDGYLETVTVRAGVGEDGGGPTGEAMRARETQVRNNLAADPPFEPWRQAAIDREYQACIAVPLVYEDVAYGVLTLYADRTGVFDGMEEAVLTELGETVGYALNALERKQALISDQSVELEFQLRRAKPPLFRFAAEHDCEFEFETVVQRADGLPGIFFTVRGVSPDEVLAFGESAPDIEELTLVSERNAEALFETRLRDSAFFSTLLDHGAMPRTLTAMGDEGYAVIRVPRSSDVRTFVDLFGAQYEDVDLVARREVDDGITTQQEFEAEVRSRLTDRQEEILATAYVSGFFDWPREMSAKDLAEMLGVSQPTVSRHIRASERKLFGLVFSDE
jgi:PAS domain S-box-containing protein